MPDAAEIDAAIQAARHASKNIKLYRNLFLDREDMLQTGLLAVARAIKDFDPTQGVPFSGYACQRARWAMWDYAKRGLRRHRRWQRYCASVTPEYHGQTPAPDTIDATAVWNFSKTVLSPQQRDLLFQRFFVGRTLADIAKDHVVSRQRIDQKVSVSLKILKNRLVRSSVGD